ncbi:hypothetical protein U1Q18_007455 [Sarracenia purpurea var. burkii]
MQLPNKLALGEPTEPTRKVQVPRRASRGRSRQAERNEGEGDSVVGQRNPRAEQNRQGGETPAQSRTTGSREPDPPTSKCIHSNQRPMKSQPIDLNRANGRNVGHHSAVTPGVMIGRLPGGQISGAEREAPGHRWGEEMYQIRHRSTVADGSG